MSANTVRLLADTIHFTGKSLLLYEVLTSSDCKGLSLKTQLLYLFVFLSRYADLLTVFLSWYNTLMKAAYIVMTVISCAAIVVKSRHQPKGLQSLDSFALWKIVVPSMFAAMIPVYFYFDVLSVPAVTEFAWYFSVTLEAFSMLPQYILLHKLATGFSKVAITFIICQGGYRMFCCLSWLLRRMAYPAYSSPYLWACGIVQSFLFILYISTWLAGRYLHKIPQVDAVLLDDVEASDAKSCDKLSSK